MVSMSSRTVTARTRRMPSSRNAIAKTIKLVSCTLPLKSSLPMTSAAAVLRGPSAAIELGLERPGQRLTVGVDPEQLFDAALGAIEPLLRSPRQPHPLFE